MQQRNRLRSSGVYGAHEVSKQNRVCLSGSLDHLGFVSVLLSRSPVICADADSRLCLFLRVWFFLQVAYSVESVRSAKRLFPVIYLPSLVGLSFGVSSEVRLRLEPFGAFDTVELTQTGQVLGSLCVFVLVEVFFLVDVGVDLIEVASVTPRLLLRVLTANGRHD